MTGPSPLPALILVRNTVSHDARVLREASTLRGLGFRVLIAGVVSTSVQGSQVVDGTPIVRLDPGRSMRRPWRLWRRGRRPGEPTSSMAAAGSPLPGSRGGAPAAGRRLLLTSAYYLQGIRLVLQTRPALIHANDYNTMWIGVAGRLLCRSRLIYDCHELWPDRNGRPEWRPWLLACEWLFVRLADATITTSPGYAKAIARRYRVPAPVLVRNIPSASGALAGPAEPALGRDGLGIYVGGLMPGRGLEEAIRALALTDRIRLRLLGPGDRSYRNWLEELAEQLGVGNRVELAAAVGPEEVLPNVAEGDFGLMLIQPICLSYELTLPNKLFEYAAAGLPILASDLPVMAQTVNQAGLGYVVPPSDLDRIARAMQQLSDPAVNRLIRGRVSDFARHTNWERERTVLESVYGTDPSDEAARVKRTYDAYASDPAQRRRWSAESPGNAAIRAELVQSVYATAQDALLGSQRVLDAGCGTGWWLRTLEENPRITAELHGLDLLTARVAAAQEKAPRASISVGDVRSLPFAEGSFGVVSLFTVLSSLAGPADIRQALAEARRVLVPRGALLIWEPRVPNPLNRSTVLVTASLLEQALAGMDIQTARITLLPPLARRLGSATPWAYPRLARVSALCTHRLVCARAPAAG